MTKFQLKGYMTNNIKLSELMPDSPLNTPVTLFSDVASEKIDDYPLIDLLSSMQLQWSAKKWELRNEQDEEKQKTMKKKLPCFTPSGTFAGGHGQEHMISHSGFLGIDIDAKDNTHIPDFEHLILQLAKNMPWCAYCGRSTRGKGFFLLIRIKDAQRHDDYWLFIQKMLERYGIQIDEKVRNANALRFVSYDYDSFWRHDAKEFDFTLPPPQKTNVRKSKRISKKSSIKNLQEWLNTNNVEYKQKTIKGHNAFLVRCPWEDMHTSDSPNNRDKGAVWQESDGKLCYKCFHSHCDKGWKDYRRFIENNY